MHGAHAAHKHSAWAYTMDRWKHIRRAQLEMLALGWPKGGVQGPMPVQGNVHIPLKGDPWE